MPTIPSVLQATGGPPRQFPGSPQDVTRSMATGAKAAVENVLPGASDAASARDSYLLGQQIGPALREGRYGDAVKAFLDSTGAAIGVLPMVPSLAGVIRAFHGTPHSFEKFDLSKLGTGEGNQAYGHGLYFAENKAIAESYREALSTGEWHADGKKLSGNDAWAAQFLNEGGGAEAAKAAAAKTINQQTEKGRAAYGEVTAAIDRLSGKKIEERSGNLYTVDLDVNHEDLLDWDAGLADQPEKVRQALARPSSDPAAIEGRLRDVRSEKKAAVDAIFGGGALDVETAIGFGEDVWRFRNPKQAENLKGLVAEEDRLQREATLHKINDEVDKRGRQYSTGFDVVLAAEAVHGSARSGSQVLREAGVPGIRYLDAGSRGGDGTRNVVMFSDDLVKIAERNGQPVAPPKPAAERATEGLAALADPRAWLKE